MARSMRSCIASALRMSIQTRSTRNCGASMARRCGPLVALGVAGKNRPEEASDHALGRSRGGFSTKIHLLCDGNGLPLHFHLTAGQDHESTALAALLEGADCVVTSGDDVPVPWPVALAGDKGYRADWIDEYLLGHDIAPVIPSKANEDRTT